MWHLVLAVRKWRWPAWLRTGIREDLRQSAFDRSVYRACEPDWCDHLEKPILMPKLVIICCDSSKTTRYERDR
jgi:hypothetical protein